jgi:hypothetical protein
VRRGSDREMRVINAMRLCVCIVCVCVYDPYVCVCVFVCVGLCVPCVHVSCVYIPCVYVYVCRVCMKMRVCNVCVCSCALVYAAEVRETTSYGRNDTGMTPE